MVENYSLVDILREVSPLQMRDFVLFLGISIPNVCSASKLESIVQLIIGFASLPEFVIFPSRRRMITS